jgi:imidazolonepropionase
MSDLNIMENAAVFCEKGNVLKMGKWPDLKDELRGITEEIDCERRVVMPGFVDSHTHPVFCAPRIVDFEKRISGASYEEIAAAGGGIRSSIDGVRSADKSQLAARVRRAFDDMAAYGTTTVEAKSGYGLSAESEIKSLEAIAEAAAGWGGTVVPTLLGAHVVPREYADKRAQYVREICEQMIPAAAKCAATELRPDAFSSIARPRPRPLADFVDVFCERGAFTADEAVEIFRAAVAHGLGTRLHLCQLSETKYDRFLEFRPASFDHMDCVAEGDLPRLADSGAITTLLPGVNFFLGLNRYPAARAMIHAGVPIALASDYNPGTSPTCSMPFVLSLACTQMRMSPAEAISAATINGACALRLQQRKGSVEPGKEADLVIFDARDYREIPYWFGSTRAWKTIVRGKVAQA